LGINPRNYTPTVMRKILRESSAGHYKIKTPCRHTCWFPGRVESSSSSTFSFQKDTHYRRECVWATEIVQGQGILLPNLISHCTNDKFDGIKVTFQTAVEYTSNILDVFKRLWIFQKASSIPICIFHSFDIRYQHFSRAFKS